MEGIVCELLVMWSLVVEALIIYIAKLQGKSAPCQSEVVMLKKGCDAEKFD